MHCACIQEATCRGYIEEDDVFLSAFLLGANESNAEEVAHSPEPFEQHADDHLQSEPEENEFQYGSAGLEHELFGTPLDDQGLPSDDGEAQAPHDEGNGTVEVDFLSMAPTTPCLDPDKSRVDDVGHGAADSQALLQRNVQPETIPDWHNFYLTWKAQSLAVPTGSWQGTCYFHQTYTGRACRKTIVCAGYSTEEQDMALRKLKSWCLKATQYTRHYMHLLSEPEDWEILPDKLLEIRGAAMPKPPSCSCENRY